MPGQPQIRHGPPQVVVGGAPQRIVVGPGGMPQLQAQPQPQPQVQAGQAGQAARFFPVNRGPAVGGATAPANSPTASVGGVQGLPAPSACASSPSAGGTASPTVAAATASPSFSSSTKVTAPAPQAPAPAAPAP
mmetsp:Transcript_26571/g.57706  ORF Transcript_26571/g.57706 Transcript_26571/m.57706 type:complete len:134 (+) Transcript_26571:108-509(+)